MGYINVENNMLGLKNKKILITGGYGFLGQYVVKELEKMGVRNIRIPDSKKEDLRVWNNCMKVTEGVDVVIHLAARIGGIGFIKDRQGEIFYNNLLMGIQMMEAARLQGVKKYIAIGTVCEYPESPPIPFKEEDLWGGFPEETTAHYGMAKKMAIVQADAYRKQYDFNVVNLIPVNLYGPRDNFDRRMGHVIPSVVKKIVKARDNNEPAVEIWGSGNATREFLYVKDAAHGIVLATEKYNGSSPVNLGTGVETPIRELVEIIVDIVGYKGKIVWDKSMPDGQPRRRLDISKARAFGYEPKTSLRTGLMQTISWYEKHKQKIKG